uniref:Predicted protein n=1 Tax=Physcomitrium patens TaxID=3218 RepID=A9U4Z6_PHYPA
MEEKALTMRANFGSSSDGGSQFRIQDGGLRKFRIKLFVFQQSKTDKLLEYWRISILPSTARCPTRSQAEKHELFLPLAQSPNIRSPFPNRDTKRVVSRHLFEEEYVVLEDLHLDCIVLKVVTIVISHPVDQQMKALESNPLVVGSPSLERHYYKEATNKN